MADTVLFLFSSNKPQMEKKSFKYHWKMKIWLHKHAFSLSASFVLIAMLNMVVCVKDGVKNNSK